MQKLSRPDGVFVSGQWDTVFSRANRLASFPIPVLIVGETGTGKELIARHIHDLSGQKKNLVVVDCNLLTETLIEAELYGAVKGAYTDLKTNRIGLVEAAQGGTLFFDEIQDLSLNQQGMLLRLIQERSYRKVGSSHYVFSDARILASTNADLEARVATGRFRKDLFERLGYALPLPPLRARPEDLPGLFSYFLGKHPINANGQVKLELGSAEFLAKLMNHGWPGNAREVQRLVERVLIDLKDGVRIITAKDLWCYLEVQVDNRMEAVAQDLGVVQLVRSNTIPRFTAIRDAEKRKKAELILTALDRTRWNRKQAAELLGVKYKALLYQMDVLGIGPNRPAEDSAAAAVGGSN